MKKFSVIILVLAFLGSCATSSSTSSNTSSNASQVQKTAPKTEGSVKFTASSPAEIKGEEHANGHDFLYLLTKKSTGNYKIEITTYKDSHDHRTTRTAYKSSVSTEKEGDKLKVTIRYAKKPNSYSWHTIPQNVFEQVYDLKTREITYSQTGSLAEKIKSKITGEPKIKVNTLSEADVIKMSVAYFIRGYEDIFEH